MVKYPWLEYLKKKLTVDRFIFGEGKTVDYACLKHLICVSHNISPFIRFHICLHLVQAFN